uniref:Soluble NSF attachment protein n=1 Tax=Chromera velia CCMP2878 TaxID=1169474 RepID=A0A0G4IC66_9ALVE|mmetsp:Transcript_49609/g.97754  ORF Transcript_49609/g.97754 Transcript_49609/m.97754 type:complete len:296 (-) Transcript_49609:331-1218(-)|eukprot:Cvel_13031.t1-p1 / transcript=Cvel_13031.t1 / gene=Cvel_13031 / organism=Chromera_velia_CCMP2878 / gene_product=Beta-soluble NSF attachment protein, putative / transcript_product=Beta-soluble NSF attachment protein, putative / location=Cvel_scaffold875:14216-18366(+) / protein_length=295 / sequence_SO=supercontig / SO=protein_coding / is_pseudo=false
MGDNAAALMAKADKKVKGGFFANLMGGERRFAEAAELYQQAANAFKLNKQWKDAGDAFMQLAACHRECGSQFEEASAYQEAGNVLKRLSSRDSEGPYKKASELLAQGGRFGQAGKILRALAEAFQAEGGKEKEAIQYFREAANMFEMDEYSKSAYSQCMIIIADLSAKEQDNLEEAIEIYEKEGEKALGNNLMQYGAKEHFLKAGILHIASNDSVNAKIALEKYESMDPRFATSREGKLLRSLVEAFEGGDVEAFVEAIAEFDNISRLDEWKTHFLFKIKQTMAPTTDGGGADFT